MFKLSSGFWIYLLTLFFLFTSALYLLFRQKNPLITNDRLLSLSSNFAIVQSDPCLLHIIGGIPFSPSPDGNIQANIICANDKNSPNYLKYSALPHHSAADALNILASVNNFAAKLDTQNKIESLGNLTNNSTHQWRVYINNSQRSEPLDKIILAINDLLEIKYE